MDAAIIRNLLDYNPDTGVFTSRRTGKPMGSKIDRGYIQINFNRKTYLAHRLAWAHVYGVWPADSLDHINRDKADNRIANLREANAAQQGQNHTLIRSNTSGFRGVHFQPKRNKYQASVRHNDKKIHLGTFDTAEQAYAAYLEGAARYHTHNPLLSESDTTIISASHGGTNSMKLQTKEDAERVLAHGTPSVNNRRHYLRYGGVFYPVPSVVWMLETGEWPASTPRHLDNDPSNNDFGNLRKPGRAAKPRKKVRETMAAAPMPLATPPLVLYDKADQAAAAIAATALEDLLGNRIPA